MKELLIISAYCFMCKTESIGYLTHVKSCNTPFGAKEAKP